LILTIAASALALRGSIIVLRSYLNYLIKKKMVMKKILVVMGLTVMLMSCGSQNSNSDNVADSVNAMDESNVPMYGDTTNQVNSNAGNYPADTSNMNADDSVKGTPSSSRRTTPGNERGDRRKQ
jgi:hypothetical protein